jgi:uncharacterized repeat protein (TIGR01451 family)
MTGAAASASCGCRDVRRNAAILGLAALLALPGVAGADGRCGLKPCKADVGISGHAEPQPIRRGETARLKITVKNNGPDGALGVWMQTDVPRQLKILKVDRYGGGWSCAVRGTFVTCDLGDFAREQEVVVVISVRGRVRGTWITDAYAYSRDGTDDNAGNGHVSMTVGVRPRRYGTILRARCDTFGVTVATCRAPAPPAPRPRRPSGDLIPQTGIKSPLALSGGWRRGSMA